MEKAHRRRRLTVREGPRTENTHRRRMPTDVESLKIENAYS